MRIAVSLLLMLGFIKYGRFLYVECRSLNKLSKKIYKKQNTVKNNCDSGGICLDVFIFVALK